MGEVETKTTAPKKDGFGKRYNRQAAFGCSCRIRYYGSSYRTG